MMEVSSTLKTTRRRIVPFGVCLLSAFAFTTSSPKGRHVLFSVVVLFGIAKWVTVVGQWQFKLTVIDYVVHI